MDRRHALGSEAMIAPAVYVGTQRVDGKDAFTLWTLTADIPGHPAGSTVSDVTLRKLGYEVPNHDSH